MGDGRDFHGQIEFLQSHVAMRLTKWRLGLQKLQINLAFDHNLRLCRNGERHAVGFCNANGHTGQATRHLQLIDADRHFLWTHEGHTRWAAKHHGTRHGLVAQCLPGLVVQVPTRTTHSSGHAHDHAVRGLQGGSVGAHVLHTRLRVFGDHIGGGECGGAIKAWSGDRDGQHVKTLALAQQICTFVDDLLALGLVHHDGFDGVIDGVVPTGLDLLD